MDTVEREFRDTGFISLILTEEMSETKINCRSKILKLKNAYFHNTIHDKQVTWTELLCAAYCAICTSTVVAAIIEGLSTHVEFTLVKAKLL